MYFSNSNEEGGILKVLLTWYQENLSEYDQYVSNTNFCNAAKVKNYSSYTSGNAEMGVAQNYNPTFKCIADGNEKGIFQSKIGLLTVDELLYAGYSVLGLGSNADVYLNNGTNYWSMSPAGYDSGNSFVWFAISAGFVVDNPVAGQYAIRPVISLKENTPFAGGDGTKDSPYTIS